MYDEIIAALERHAGVADWSVARRRSRDVQLYLIGPEVESQREVITEAFDVEVYNNHQRPDGSAVRGVASVRLVRISPPPRKRLLAELWTRRAMLTMAGLSLATRL